MIFYMSVVAPDLSIGPGSGEPGGPGFLGVVITQGDDRIAAMTYAIQLIGLVTGISHHLELDVKQYELPDGAIDRQYFDRVLTADEAQSIPEPA